MANSDSRKLTSGSFTKMEPFPLTLEECYPEVSPVKRNGFHPKRRIGYWMSPKKLKKMDMTKFALVCRAGGYELIQVDFSRPLEEQGPFDIFFHKLTDMIVRAEQPVAADHTAVELFRDLENYLRSHPETVIIDPIQNLKKLLLRKTQYYLTATSDACKHNQVFSPPFVELFASSPEDMLRELRKADVTFPIVCKPLEAHGSDAHRMMIVFNAAGLKCIKVPCVVQSFVNHDAILYKVFVIGDQFHVVRRPSFQNFWSTDLPPIVFDSQNITGAQWLCDDPVSAPQMSIAASSTPSNGIDFDPGVLSSIVTGIRRQFGLSLIGIDLVHDISSQKLAIIDVNAFPSYDGVPDFFQTLFSFLHSSVVTKRPVKARSNGLIHSVPRSLNAKIPLVTS